MKRKQEIRKENGITLIALVITIIVLLILAGVSISALSGENGILSMAVGAKNSTVVAEEKEAISLAWQSIILEREGNDFYVEANELETKMHSEGKDSVRVTGSGDLTVTYSDTGHSYMVSQNGEIISEDLEEIIEVADTNPGEFRGIGTEDNPYLIESIEDLVALSTKVNSGETYTNKYFELSQTLDFNSDKSYVNAEEKYLYKDDVGGYEKDINGEVIMTLCTTGEGFIPIGLNYSSRFEGIFEGNGNSIKNMYLNARQGREHIGLFGVVDNECSINNLILTGQIIVRNLENGYYIGSIVGYANNNGETLCSIENCYSKVNITCEAKKWQNVGGIAGCMYGSIKNTTNDGKIVVEGGDSGSFYEGGIVGIICVDRGRRKFN